MAGSWLCNNLVANTQPYDTSDNKGGLGIYRRVSGPESRTNKQRGSHLSCMRQALSANALHIDSAYSSDVRSTHPYSRATVELRLNQ